ncbi:hypothetical protein HWV62_33615 [Athelia sp. TMB]|nr:hypothetical protein HWV62_33615 [Athelia sp. TMB]
MSVKPIIHPALDASHTVSPTPSPSLPNTWDAWQDYNGYSASIHAQWIEYKSGNPQTHAARMQEELCLQEEERHRAQFWRCRYGSVATVCGYSAVAGQIRQNVAGRAALHEDTLREGRLWLNVFCRVLVAVL